MANRKHGGRRQGAGRPLLPEHQKRPPTVVKRLPKTDWEKLDYYKSLEVLLESWQSESDLSSATSPRWAKLRQLLEEWKALRNSSLMDAHSDELQAGYCLIGDPHEENWYPFD